jgi:hypothetical protein
MSNQGSEPLTGRNLTEFKELAVTSAHILETLRVQELQEGTQECREAAEECARPPRHYGYACLIPVSLR